MIAVRLVGVLVTATAALSGTAYAGQEVVGRVSDAGTGLPVAGGR
jgi:hypothetical protein